MPTQRPTKIQAITCGSTNLQSYNKTTEVGYKLFARKNHHLLEKKYLKKVALPRPSLGNHLMCTYPDLVAS